MKRKLETLLAIYEREPYLKDIFTEGYTDKCIVEWYIRNNNFPNVKIHSIEDYEISDEILQKYGLNKSSK